MEKKRTQGHHGNVYDRIFKENAEQLFIPLVEFKLGIKIKFFQPLQEKITKTIEREVDFLYQIVTDEEVSMLLHLEFQTENDKQMIYRMAEYHGLIYKKHQLPIAHIVIYLGTKKPNMQTKLKGDEVFSGFELINIHELNTKQLLSSQIPEVIVLTLLSDYETERTEAILRLIVKQLKKVALSQKDLRKYLAQLILLARLRRLESLTKKIISEMPIIYDIEQDDLYKEGVQKGFQKGEQKGIQKGIQQGIIQERQKNERQRKKADRDKLNSIQALIQLGTLADAQITQIMNISKEELNNIKKNLK